MRGPTDAEIKSAEERLMRARREVLARSLRVKIAGRAALVKPVTLLGVAGAAGIAGYLMFRRPVAVEVPRWSFRRQPTTASTATTAAASTSIAGLVVAFAMRYAMQRLPGIGIKLVEDTLRKRGMWPLHRAGEAPPRYGSASLH